MKKWRSTIQKCTIYYATIYSIQCLNILSYPSPNPYKAYWSGQRFGGRGHLGGVHHGLVLACNELMECKLSSFFAICSHHAGLRYDNRWYQWAFHQCITPLWISDGGPRCKWTLYKCLAPCVRELCGQWGWGRDVLVKFLFSLSLMIPSDTRSLFCGGRDFMNWLWETFFVSV